MFGVTILSPHRDDAVFSLYLSMLQWAECGVSVRVLNFFTESSYGPRLATRDRAAVSDARRQEDRRALATVSVGSVNERSCRLLDAPLRPPIDFGAVCRPETASLLTREFIQNLSDIIEGSFRRGFVLAPLALGDHVDHVAVRQAAIAVGDGRRLGFYEDLPYATWTSEKHLNELVNSIQYLTKTKLAAHVHRRPRDVQAKRRAAAMYRSQISFEEARAIARHTLKYRGGERIWIPTNSRYLMVLEGRSRNSYSTCQSVSAKGH